MIYYVIEVILIVCVIYIERELAFWRDASILNAKAIARLIDKVEILEDNS